MTNGRPELWDRYLEMNIRELLTIMLYFKEKNRHEKQLAKQRR